MAKIRFKCGCGKGLAVDEQHAGKTAKCPACQRPLRVPDVQNAPEPSEIAVPGKRKSTGSLRSAYGDALQAQSRRERTEAALAEYSRKARKRNLIIAASVVAVLLVAFMSYRVFRTVGISPPQSKCPEVTWPFLDGLSEEDPRERAAATWEVADAGGSEITWVISEMSKEDEPLVALVAVRSIGRIGKEGVEESLVPLLDSPSRDVRMTAAFVIAECAAQDGAPGDLVPWMTKALSGDERWAAWFGEMTQEDARREDIVTALDQARRSPKPTTRAMAAWLIAATLGPDQMILPLLRDAEPDVVISTVNALAPFLTRAAFERLGQGEDGGAAVRQRLAVLNNVAQRLRHDDPRVRQAAALVLAANEQDESSGLFRKALNDDDWFVRFAALKGLSLLSPKVARHVVRTAAEEDIHRDNAWTQRVNRRIEERAQREQLQGEDDA